MSITTAFVDRTHQLAQLDRFLAQALSAHGQICFVTGDAGAGKTTLALEFIRRAEARQPDLVAAVAMGDPQTGASDPYLIFREVLALLTGDVEARLAEGAITQEGARRLQGALRTSIDCLVEFGPDLIGLFVPGWPYN
jgi:Cdc6-like AAA superfamily ATPase